ncbi:MAG TPA: hypothetical protein VLV86_13385 [Vicinamibacterales bacterium]|nr:hypothetical protein [Vicinamibacterales bacterium]
MSPILVRPVREQLEHDRLIRLLQTKLRRKFDAGINPGAEQNASVGNGTTVVYPDLVLFSLERGRRIQGVIEVETGESVNHLEALAQWTNLSKLRVPFHLYVPATMVDVARRLCEDNQIGVHEIWSYHAIGDQVRFALVHRSKELPIVKSNGAKSPEAPPVKKVAAPAPAKPKKSVAPAKNGKTASKPAKKKPAAKVKKSKRK